MLIVCKSCAARMDWKKEQGERLSEKTCSCGGTFTRLDCYKEGCRYTQLTRCKAVERCEIRRNKNV